MADRNLRLKMILEGLDRVTAPLKSITNASSAARKDLAETHNQLKALDNLQKQVGRYKTAEGRFAGDTRDLETTRTRLAELRQQIEATENPTKKLRTEFEKAERQAAALAQRVDAGGAELQQLSRQLSEAGIDVADLARHEDRLAHRTYEANQALRQQEEALDRVNAASRNSQKLNDVSAKASGAGLGMIAAGTAAGVPVVAATKQAMSLESAMADVSKVTNMTRPQVEQMSNDFIDMSENIPMAANELAAIAAQAGAAGVGMDKFGKPMANQRAQLLEFTNDAAQMGVAFDMNADTAGETMAKWRTAFELPQAGVRALGDRVNALTNTFGGKAANVTDIITRIGPLGKVAGLAAPQIAALGSTLDSIGVPSEVAATGIKNTMLALTKGEAATKGQQGAFKALGLEATDVAKRMQHDAAGAIVDVMERIGKMDADQQSGILTQLFGSESVAAIAPMLTNLDGLKQRLGLVADESKFAGSMQAEFLNRIATSEGATGLATNALSGLNITMGKALLPTVVQVAGVVKNAASAMRNLAQQNPMIAKGIMIFMGAGSALLILLGGLTLAFAGLTAAAAPLGIALGPLLLIVAAIAAIAAAAYLIYNNWKNIGSIFDPLIASGRVLLASMLGFIGQIGNALTLLWDGPLGERLRIVISLLQELALIVASAIGGTVITVLNTLMTVAAAVFDFIGNAIGLVAALLTGDFAGAWTAVEGMFVAGANAIVAILSGLISVFTTLGGAIMDGLVAGIKAGWKMLVSTISEVAALLPESVKKLLGIHSPSRVFADIGGYAMEGLDKGLSANAASPLQRVLDLSGQMTRALALGAATPSIAMAANTAASPAGAGAASASAPTHVTYAITVQVSGGAQGKDIGEEVRKAIEQLERERRGRGFGDEGDY